VKRSSITISKNETGSPDADPETAMPMKLTPSSLRTLNTSSSGHAFRTGCARSYRATISRVADLVRMVILLGCLWSLGMSHALAQARSAPSPASRFLLVIETSQAMGGRAEGLYAALEALAQNTLPPIMRKGDTLGVWAYDQELLTGEFALQRWTPETANAVRDRILSFARSHRYQKSGRLAAVQPAMERLIKDSPCLTVFLFITSETDLQKFIAAEQVDQVFAKWRKEQQRTKMPFIVVLRYRDGQPYDHSITPVPFSVELAPIPLKAEPVAATPVPAPVATPEAAPVATNAPPPAPPVIGEPLIVIGKKGPKPEEVPPAAAPSTGGERVPGTNVPAGSPTPPPAVQPQPSVPTVTAPKPESAPVVAAKPAANPEPAIKATATPVPGATPGVGTNSEPGAIAKPVASPNTASNTTAGEIATATPGSGQKLIWLLATGIGLALLAVAARSMLRRRQSSHASLITRSLEKHQDDHTP